MPGGGDSSRRFLMDRVGRLLSGSSSSRLVREDAYPADCFTRSKKEEAAEEVVESLLRLVAGSRESYDGLGLRRERDDGIGGACGVDRLWFIEVMDFWGRTWRVEGREEPRSSPSLSYRPRSASRVLVTERARGPGPLGRPPPARERLDISESEKDVAVRKLPSSAGSAKDTIRGHNQLYHQYGPAVPGTRTRAKSR